MEKIKFNGSFFIVLLLFFTTTFAQTFEDVSTTLGINTYAGFLDASVAVIDFENDGWEDLLFTSSYSNGLKGSTKLYKNINGNSFLDVTSSSKLDSLNIRNIYTVGASVGDIDNDGDKDIVFATFWGNNDFSGRPLLYENLGNGTFKEIQNAFEINTYNWGASVSLGDVNNDGYLDVYFGNYTKTSTFIYDANGNEIGYIPEGLPNKLFINNKNKSFTNVTTLYNLTNLGATYVGFFTDVDFDHNADLMVGNDFGEWIGPFGLFPNAMYKNNYPTPTFTDNSQQSNLNTRLYCMGAAVGDYDNDLDIDFYFTNIGANYLMQHQPNHTFLNTAAFAKVTDSVDVPNGLKKTSWGALFLDMDNDEDVDLYVNSGWFNISFPNTTVFDSNRLFSNNGNGTFDDITTNSGIGSILSHRGCAQLDFNKDGKIDIVSAVANISFPSTPTETPHSFLYKNKQANSNNFVNIKLQGVKCNRDAYGSKVIIYYGNNKHQIREVSGGGDSHSSISSPIQHFGLSNYTTIDSINVYWLGGNKQTLKNIDVNQTLLIIEDTSKQIISNIKSVNSDLQTKVFPTVISDFSQINIDNINNLKSIEIFNSFGQLMFSNYQNGGNLNNISQHIFINDKFMENGIYYLKLTDFTLNTKSFKILYFR